MINHFGRCECGTPTTKLTCERCSIKVEREFLAAGKVAGFDTDDTSKFPRLHPENEPPKRKTVFSLSFLPPGGFK